MKRFFKLLFIFIPWYCLIGIPLGLIFKFLLKETPLIPNIALMWLFYFLFIPVSYLIREVGRLFWARIMGGIPHHIVIGTGNQLDEFEIFRLKVAVYEKINAGISQAFFAEQPFLKFRFGIYLAGRVLTSGGLVMVLALIWELHPEALIGKHPPHLFTAFIIANLQVLLANLLWTIHYDYRQVNFATDGLTLWKLRRVSREALITDILDIQLLDAQDYVRQGKYERAIQLYKKLIDDPQERNYFRARLNFGIFLLKQAMFQESLQMYQSIESLIQKSNFSNLIGIWYQGVAWNYLALEGANKAYIYAQNAYKLTPKDANAQVVYGAALVTEGMPEEGINVLKQLVDFHSTQEHSIKAAIFVCDGLLRQGERYQANGYYNYIQRQVRTLSKMDQYFWNRVYRTFMGTRFTD